MHSEKIIVYYTVLLGDLYFFFPVSHLVWGFYHFERAPYQSPRGMHITSGKQNSLSLAWAKQITTFFFGRKLLNYNVVLSSLNTQWFHKNEHSNWSFQLFSSFCLYDEPENFKHTQPHNYMAHRVDLGNGYWLRQTIDFQPDEHNYHRLLFIINVFFYLHSPLNLFVAIKSNDFVLFLNARALRVNQAIFPFFINCVHQNWCNQLYCYVYRLFANSFSVLWRVNNFCLECANFALKVCDG